MKYTKEQVLAIIGPDTRHITNSKEIEDIIEINEGNVTAQEIIEEAQKEINAENRLRAEQRALLEKYEMGMRAADESSRVQKKIMKPKKTREVIKYC